jgi:hypothetical protein
VPNHIFTEIAIPVSEQDHYGLLALICDHEGKVDFETLLPIPINYWQGSVGKEHSVFLGNALDWCRANWGTKWNACGERSAVYADGVLTLRFKTAWGTPRGWMCALFNTTRRSFAYRFLDEGADVARAGRFTFEPAFLSDREWEEHESPADTDALGALLWGEEAWEEIRAERTADDEAAR